MKPRFEWLTLLIFAWTPPARAESSSYEVTSTYPAQIQFIVNAPLDSIVGTSQGLLGTVEVDEQSLNGSARLTADLKSFRTGISLRDEDLRNRFFEVDRFPKATLQVHRLVADDPRGMREALATLSLHGVERLLRIPIKMKLANVGARPALWVEASFDVVLADYGIKRPAVLFLKLGDTAHVRVQALFLRASNMHQMVASADAPAVETDLKPRLFKRGAFVPVARKADSPKGKERRYLFAASTAEGRGERSLDDPSIGGSGNAVACSSCHSAQDERMGMRVNGFVAPNRTLFDSAKRGTLWQGLAKGTGKAASLCSRLFMLAETGLDAKHEADIEAYLKAISVDDAVAALDYRVLAITRSASLRNPTQGNRRLGAVLEKRFCENCHAVGKIRAPLTPGLYEPDYIVRRVRWLPGHDARQMPPIYVDRLTDTDLRHIVTYLSGDESQRIFDRRIRSARKED
jgi:polyisoprenoid-binding protein YceI/mono/diheme cytochrome c family protein